MKKLYLSSTDKKIFGVLGGLGEYFAVDSTLLRIIFIFIAIFSGFFPGLIFYFLATLVIPRNPNLDTFDSREKIKS